MLETCQRVPAGVTVPLWSALRFLIASANGWYGGAVLPVAAEDSASAGPVAGVT